MGSAAGEEIKIHPDLGYDRACVMLGTVYSRLTPRGMCAHVDISVGVGVLVLPLWELNDSGSGGMISELSQGKDGIKGFQNFSKSCTVGVFHASVFSHDAVLLLSSSYAYQRQKHIRPGFIPHVVFK